MESIEKLTIETPEQVGLEFPLAGIGSRFLAFTIDTLLQVVVVVIVFMISLFFLPGLAAATRGSEKWLLAGIVLGVFVIYWGYFALFETFWHGQTPGKRQIGIRVIKDNGAGITATDALSRNLLRAIDSMPGFYGVGVLAIFLSKQNKRLGDYVAGTVVVHERADEEAQPYWNTREQSGESMFAVPNILPEEVEMLESFLGRRVDLDPKIRDRIARQLADRIVIRLQLQPQERPRDEDLIEAVVRQYRKSANFR